MCLKKERVVKTVRKMIRLLRESFVLFILHGAIFLALYRVFIGEVYGLLLFAASSVAFSLGINRLVTIVERRIRGTNTIRFPFARVLYFLIPCGFAFYLLHTFQDFTPRLILAVLVAILAFLSVYSFSAAMGHTSLSRRRINFSYGLFLLIGFHFLASFLTRNIGVLLLLPLSVILTLTEFMQFSFFGEVGRPYYFRTILFTGFIAIVFYILLVMNLVASDVISKLYDTVIKVYLALLAVSISCALYVLRQRRRPGSHAAITTMPMVGLVSFYLVFVGIAVLGILMGTQIDASIFTQGTTIETIFSTSLSAMTLFRVLIMYFVVLSFPFTLVQSYAVIRNILG